MSTEYDPFLLDNYRVFCRNESIVPKDWLERRLLQIPTSLLSLSLSLTPGDGEGDVLTENETCHLVQSLLSNRASNVATVQSKLSGQILLTKPSVAKQLQKSFGTGFIVPGTHISTSTKPNTDSPTTAPLKALQMGGDGMTIKIFREMTFLLMELSHDCVLTELIIDTAAKQTLTDDMIQLLATCGPLKRSLRKFVLKNSPLFQLRCGYSWVLFFGTTPLEHLTIENTGMNCAQMSMLCQILCDSEVSQRKMRILKWKQPRNGADTFVLFDDLEFVNVQRCISKLSQLQYFEIDGLTTDQQYRLCQEWSVVKRTHQSLDSSLSEGDFRLTILPNAVEDSLNHPIAFEKLPELRSFFRSQPRLHHNHTSTKDCALGGSYSFSMLQMSPPTTLFAASNVHKPLVAQQSRQKSLSTCQNKFSDSDLGSASLTAIERVYQKYKPPPQPRRASTKFSGAKNGKKRKKRRQNLFTANLHRDGTRPLKHFFTASRSASVSITSSCSDVVSSEDETKERLQFKRIYSPRPNDFECRSNDRHAPPNERHRETYISDRWSSDCDDDVDAENEKLYGPPPGGRKVELQDAYCHADLKGYMSDGFIRPDGEVVYTTSASDEEIEQDLAVLCGRNRRRLVFSHDSSASSEAELADNDTTTLKSDVQNEITALQVVEEPQFKEQMANRSEEDSRMKLHGLEKELKELQPFHYDANRERFRPGEFFDCEHGHVDGITLRSGRHVTEASESYNPAAEIMCISEEDPDKTSTDQEFLSEKSVLAHEVNIVKDRPAADVGNNPPMQQQQQQLETEAANTDALLYDVSKTWTKDEPELDSVQPMKRKNKMVAMKRIVGNRVQQRLQVWAWDRNFDKCPPNERMYLAREARRLRSSQSETRTDSK